MIKWIFGCLFGVFLPLSGFSQEIKVMVIDTGVDATHLLIAPYIATSDTLVHAESYTDSNVRGYHGTHVAYLIVKDTCRQVKLYSCKYLKNQQSGYDTAKLIISCFKRAKDEHMDYINFSSSGDGPWIEEYETLKLLLADKHVTMVVAAGNEGHNSGNMYPCWGSFPGCYGFDNLITVGSLSKYGPRVPSSNYGVVGMKWTRGEDILSATSDNEMKKMSGTSQATARYTNFLLKQKCHEINKGDY